MRLCRSPELRSTNNPRLVLAASRAADHLLDKKKKEADFAEVRLEVSKQIDPSVCLQFAPYAAAIQTG